MVSSSPGNGVAWVFGVQYGTLATGLEPMPSWGPRLVCVQTCKLALWGLGFTLY